jgi:hypothetical protein
MLDTVHCLTFRQFALFPSLGDRLSSSLSSSSACQHFMGHSLPWISWQQDFYGVEFSTPHPATNLEDQASLFVTPRNRITKLHHQALCNHFCRLLRHTWATFGLFLSSGHQTEKVIYTDCFSSVLSVTTVGIEARNYRIQKKSATTVFLWLAS